MTSRIVVTGGAIIRDHMGRILLQKRSDYGDWGLPGGGMEPGESIEETMIREVKEETGLDVSSYELASIYTGEKMKYTYPDGNEVVFVMFLFNVTAELEGNLILIKQPFYLKMNRMNRYSLFLKVWIKLIFPQSTRYRSLYW